jgi:hypothetical protein
MIFMDLLALFSWGTTSAPPQVVIDLSKVHVTVDKQHYVSFKPVLAAGINKTANSYLGFSGTVPDGTQIDWNKNIVKLWKQKLQITNVSPATKQSVFKTTYSYTSRPAEVMTVSSHINQLNWHLKMINYSINWSELCADSRIKHCASFKRTAMSIDGNMLTAYSMTELMPYQIGRQNYEMMNLYMRNAGRNYLDTIPSLGDPLLSMGRYQFTSYAVGHDKNGPRSANKIAQYAPGFGIPQSVIALRGLSSDRAAYYFSIYNIGSLYRAMSDKQVLTYDQYCRGKEPLTEYIATAHHNPRVAKRNMLRWIDGKCKNPLAAYQTGDLKLYTKKTSMNYAEVLKRT